MVASTGMRINQPLVVVLLACAGCAGSADPELVERFRVTCARLAAEAAGTSVVTGHDGWYFAAEEIATLGAELPASDAAVAGLAAAAERLRRDGIELVVAPVPPKGIIYADRVATALELPIPLPRLDNVLAGVYAAVRARGVLLVDLTEPFIRDRFHPEGPLYCRQDSHWSGVGCVVAAQVIASAVRDTGVLGPEPDPAYGLAWFATPISGDLRQRLPEPPRREEVRVRGLIEPDDPLLTPAVRSENARVAIVGDTHTLVFHGGEPYHASGAGIAEQLAFELREPVALYPDDGSSFPANALELPALDARTGLVIWIFAATRLLGGA